MLSPINTAHFVLPLSLVWWIFYLPRLFNMIRRTTIFKMPTFYLWIMAFNLGIIFILHNYTLEAQLHAYFVGTNLPVISLLKVSLSSGFITYGYLLVVRRYTEFDVPRIIDLIMLSYIVLMIAFNLLAYPRVPYVQIQIVSNCLVSVANLSAAMSLIPMTRELLQRQKNAVREAHHLWFLAFLFFSSTGATLYLIDGIHKLLTNAQHMDTSLYVLAEICRCAYMFSLAVLIGPDRYLYWIFYPVRVRTFFQLKRLCTVVYQIAGETIPYNIPEPRPFTLSSAELGIYRMFIAIMDALPALPQDTELYPTACHHCSGTCDV